MNNDQIPHRSSSEPTLSLLNLSILGRLWSTTGDLEIKPSRKCVRFSNSVQLILIPTRDEFCKAGLDSLLWWINEDYSTFKFAAVSELRNLMMLDSRIDCKMAQLVLYQPMVSCEHMKIRSMLQNLSHHSALRDLFSMSTAENIQLLQNDDVIDIGIVKIESDDVEDLENTVLDNTYSVSNLNELHGESSQVKSTDIVENVSSVVNSVASNICLNIYSKNLNTEIPLFLKKVLSHIDLSKMNSEHKKYIRKCNSIDSIDQYVDRFKEQGRFKVSNKETSVVDDIRIPLHPLAYICSQ